MRSRSNNPALQNGLLFGIILGVIETVLYFLLGTVGLIINILLFLFFTAYAGYRASTLTGKVSTSILAGLLVGLISSVIASVPLLIYLLSNIDSFRAQVQQEMAGNSMYQGVTITNSLVIASVILFLVLLVAGATLLGLAFGSIGGAIGKRRSPSLQYSAAMPHPPQGNDQSPLQADKPLYPPPDYSLFDYTSPEAYMLPQEKTVPQTNSGQSIGHD